MEEFSLKAELSSDEMRNIFGMRDAFIKKVESSMNVRVVSRNGFLYVYGSEENAAKAMAVIMDLKDYLVEINNPNVVINKFQFNLREGVLTKKMIAIEKNSIEFDLKLDKHYSIDDLTSIDYKKERYLATHYQLCPGATLPKSRKKVLIIANNPYDQIQNMFQDEKLSVSYMTSDTVFFADTPHAISIMFRTHKDLDIIGSELAQTLFDFFKHVKYDFVYIDECLFSNPNTYGIVIKIQETMRYKK